MKSLSVICFLLCRTLLVNSQPMVKVEQGWMVGETSRFENDFLNIQRGIDVFLGIPYAEPPIGDNRFRAPLPKQPWNEGDVYNATYNRDVCMQTGVEADKYFTKSEDCLHLNVYAPNPVNPNTAVMFFIHGGGYFAGNGYFGYYSGIPLSTVGDVIVVTINYRVTAFGDEASPGNYGMLDQVEALRWVKTNIQAFGGDPNRITIFGESAGAGSVSAHLFSPLSRDLFHQAIIESGSVLAPLQFHHDLDEQRAIAYRIGEKAGCPATNTQQLISCLRSVDAETLNTAATEIAFIPAPCVDNNFLIESPLTSLENGNFMKCPLIDGFNRDEGTLLISLTEFGRRNFNSSETPHVSIETLNKELRNLLTFFKIYYNDLIVDSMQQEYVDWAMSDDPEADYFDPWKYLMGDLGYSCPASMETRSHARAGETAIYQYYFTHIPSLSYFNTPGLGSSGPKWFGAGHAEELGFVFGYPFKLPVYYDPYTYPEEEMQLSLNMMTYWTNFAKTGNPNKNNESSDPYDDERAWPAFNFPNSKYKEITVNLTSGRGIRADECHFWNDYLQKLTTFAADLTETERQWREEFYAWKYMDMDEWRDAFDKYKNVLNTL